MVYKNAYNNDLIKWYAYIQRSCWYSWASPKTTCVDNVYR